MSSFDFLAKMGITKLGKLGDSITTAIVQFDPETASQVEIDNMAQHCRDLASRIAEAETKENRDHKTMDDLRTSLNNTTQAAGIVGNQLTAAHTADTKGSVQMFAATLEASLNKLMDQIATIGGDEGDGSVSGTLFDAIQNHAQSEGDLHEWQTVHAGAVAALTTARSRLEKAKNDMQHATDQEIRAKERQAQAERDAGLKGTGLAQNVALSAMQAAADAAKPRARAATINTESIKATTGNSADDIVAAALAQARTEAPPISALDRLAKLQNKA